MRYARNRAWLTDFHGRHGATVLRIKQATALFPAEGGFWAQLDRLRADPLVPDADLQRALPPVGSRVLTAKGQGRVQAQEVLARKVLVEFEDGRRLHVPAAEILTRLGH